MKIFTFNILCLFFFTLGCSKKNETVVKCINLPSYDNYNYPILPGTPEWAQLQTGEEMFIACQLPNNILSSISTDGLVVSVLNHPMFMQIYAYDNLQHGYNSFVDNSNAFFELENRLDAGLKLFKRYELISPTCIKEKITELEKGNFSLHLAAFEILLGQDVFIEQLSIYERKELVKKALQTYQEKVQLPHDYAGLSLRMTAFLCAKVMFVNQYPPFIEEFNQNEKLQILVYTTQDLGNSQLSNIIKLSKSFIK